jgi:protocatechuate 3,4-dioxygenase beta subunit
MKNAIAILFVLILTSACAGAPPRMELPPQPTLEAAPAPTTEPGPTTPEATETEQTVVSTQAVAEDLFSQMGITLPMPVCAEITPSQTEGPYYTPNTPERNSLLEEGMPGTRLVLVGYVLDQDCQPLANAWLDFWQADANGEYDNAGYRLRGHQFTDAQGRYYLETVVPGEYPGRTEHIHVKVQPEDGNVLTSQLYFPDVPANQRDGIFSPSLIVQIEERDGYLVAYFNFVVQR